MNNRSPNILVVDDEVDICANLSDILGDLGYAVDVAYDGVMALDLVRRNTYDVALLDLKMPGIDGIELYREIKKIRSDTVAIIVTAYAGENSSIEAQTAGAWKVLSKPLDFSRLLQSVEEAMGQPLVMVVDDDDDLRANLWDLLRDRGYRVGLARDEPEAEELLKDRGYHVVMIDMKLGKGNGASVYRYVRRTTPNARTMVVTGYRVELDQQVNDAIREGADAIFYKPFDLPAFLTTLKQLSALSAKNE